MLKNTNLVYRIREALRFNDLEAMKRLFTDLDDSLSNGGQYPTQWITNKDRLVQPSEINTYAPCGHKVWKYGRCGSKDCTNYYWNHHEPAVRIS